MQRLKPSLAASFSLRESWLTARSSPDRPTSPTAARSLASGTFCRLEAMARMAEVHCHATVALPAYRNLCAALLEGMDKPRFVGLFDVVRDLNGTHSWTLSVDGAWLLGRPMTVMEHGVQK